MTMYNSFIVNRLIIKIKLGLGVKISSAAAITLQTLYIDDFL